MTLSTTNATKLTKYDFNNYTVSYVAIETDIPYIIGNEESSICRISKDGYLSFTDPPYQLDWPTWYTYLDKPMVFPYWSYLYSFAYSDSAVYYQLLESAKHNNTENWNKVVEIMTNYSGGRTFRPLNALIVTWNKMQPYSYYYWMCDYCNYYYRSLGYSWAQYYCQYCDTKQEFMSFQAIVTRNETHSFVIFNYGQFQLNEWRWYYFYVAAGFTDGYRKFSVLPFSYYWWRNYYTTDNLMLGNVGKLGRHVLLMADSIPPSDKLKCTNWMAGEVSRPLKTQLSCSNCPRDLRQAILDWRYWPYEYKCDKRNQNEKGSYDMYMCFEGSYECVQYFPPRYDCPWFWWSWYCSYYTQCQFYSAPRCCYKMTINWKKDGLLQNYCDSGYSLWTMRWLMRNIMFDRSESGSLVQSTALGAGHSQILERRDYYDWWWIYNYDEQRRSESYGFGVCTAGKVYDKFTKLRPKCSSDGYSEPAWGFNRGDPHITTIDGITYSFNGLCEYYMIRNSSQSVPKIDFQARTGLATSANPNVTSGATIFTGFALKAGNNNYSIAVLYNSTTNDLDVYRDKELLGSVLTYFYGLENATTIERYSLKASDNKSITVSDSTTGFSVTVTRVLNFLQTTVQLDQSKHQNGVDGLMGNFNGNTSDDFKMRNGTQLPGNSSERTLFEFGQSWAVLATDESLFPYFNGQGRSDFCNMSFIPVFVEDYKDNLLGLFKNNSGLMTSANTTCWNANQAIYLSCMYDAAQLQTLDAAQAASLTVREEVSAKAVASNRAPEFNMPQNITIYASTTYNVSLNVTDKDGNPISLVVKEPSNDSSVWLIGNVLLWQVGLNWNATNLSIVATDSVGAPASWTPVILYCDCRNGGACNFNYTTSTTAVGATFYKAQCNCPSGYQGDRCEVSPCNAQPSPCYNASMCHMYANGSYYCDSCPSGMVGSGRTCEDTNECLETPGICQDQCTNLVPGFRCNCTTAGFQVSATNRTRCEDINECLTGAHKCRTNLNQTCVNTNGSYTCACPLPGYELNALYDCQDIDECAVSATNPCGSDRLCVNTVGSYQCTCAYGKIMVAGQCREVAMVSDSESTTLGSTADSTNTALIASVTVAAVVTVTLVVTLAVVLSLRARPPVEDILTAGAAQ